MVYALFRPGFEIVAFIETWDGEVTDAPDSWRWSIGRGISEILTWAFEHGWKWKVAPQH